MFKKLELLPPSHWKKGWQKRDQIAFRRLHGMYYSAGFLKGLKETWMTPGEHSNMIREFFGGPPAVVWSDTDCLKPSWGGWKNP